MPRSRKVWSLSLLLLAPLFAARAAAPAATAARESTVISLRSGVIDTSRPQPAIPESLSVRPGGADADADEVVLVKFPAPPSQKQIAALQAASLRVYAYLPYYSYLVKMPAGKRGPATLAAIGASWAGPYQPLYKLSPAIAGVVAGDGIREGAAGNYRPVMIQVYPDADLGEVVRKIRELGVKGIAGARRNPFFSRVRLLLRPTEIATLRDVARQPARRVLDRRRGRAATLLNDTTIWVGQSGLERRPDDAGVRPGHPRRGPGRRLSSTPASTPTRASSATPPAACRRATRATAARWSIPRSARSSRSTSSPRPSAPAASRPPSGTPRATARTSPARSRATTSPTRSSTTRATAWPPAPSWWCRTPASRPTTAATSPASAARWSTSTRSSSRPTTRARASTPTRGATTRTPRCRTTTRRPARTSTSSCGTTKTS